MLAKKVAQMSCLDAIDEYIDGLNKNMAETLHQQIRAALIVSQKYPHLYGEFDSTNWANLKYCDHQLLSKLGIDDFKQELSKYGAIVSRKVVVGYSSAMDYYGRTLLGSGNIKMIGGDGGNTGCWSIEGENDGKIISYSEGNVVTMECQTPIVFEKEKQELSATFALQEGGA